MSCLFYMFFVVLFLLNAKRKCKSVIETIAEFYFLLFFFFFFSFNHTINAIIVFCTFPRLCTDIYKNVATSKDVDFVS